MPTTQEFLGQFGIIQPTEQGQQAPTPQPATPNTAQAVVDAVLGGPAATPAVPAAPVATAPAAPAVAPAAPQAAPQAAPTTATPTAPSANGAAQGGNSAAATPATTTGTAAPAAAEPASPWDAVLDGPKSVTFTEEEDKVFQTRFGKKAQDFTSHYAQVQEEARSARQAAAEYEAFKSSWEKAPVEIRNAFDKALQGENWRDYLTKTPSFDWASPADKQDHVRLIDHYIPGSLTQEEREALAGRDVDDGLKARAGSLFATASKMFEAERTAHNSHIETRNAEQQRQKAETAASVDAAFAYVKERYPALAPELTEDLKNDMIGFKAPFDAVMEANGLRYSQEAAFRLIVAKNLDKVLARVSERARAQGRNEGVMEASQSVPATARVAAAAAPTPPVATGSSDPVMSLVDQVNQRVRASQGPSPFRHKQT